MSTNDYTINVLAHIQSGFDANFGLKNAKVLRGIKITFFEVFLKE